MKLITKIYDETLSNNENQFWFEDTWSLVEKLEYDLTLQNNSISIPVSAIDYIKMIILETNNEVDMTLYRESTNESFSVSSLFLYTPSDTEGLVSIDISELSNIEANIKLRVYGYTPES